MKELINKLMAEAKKFVPENNNYRHSYSMNEWFSPDKSVHRLYLNRTNGRNQSSRGYISVEGKVFNFSNLDCRYELKELLKSTVKREGSEVE